MLEIELLTISFKLFYNKNILKLIFQSKFIIIINYKIYSLIFYIIGADEGS